MNLIRKTMFEIRSAEFSVNRCEEIKNERIYRGETIQECLDKATDKKELMIISQDLIDTIVNGYEVQRCWQLYRKDMEFGSGEVEIVRLGKPRELSNARVFEYIDENGIDIVDEMEEFTWKNGAKSIDEFIRSAESLQGTLKGNLYITYLNEFKAYYKACFVHMEEESLDTEELADELMRITCNIANDLQSRIAEEMLEQITGLIEKV